MGLDVRVVGAEELLRAIDGECFRDIDELTSAVIPLARVPFGVFVRHDRPDGLEDGRTDEVLGGNQFQSVVLALNLLADGGGDVRIGLGQVRHAGVSIAVILSRRRWWRPPSYGVSRKIVTSSRACGSWVSRAPSASTLALL